MPLVAIPPPPTESTIPRPRPKGAATVTFDVDNLFSTHGLRNRLFTFPNRALPKPSLNEFRERNSHPSFALTLKRTFGGSTSLAKADTSTAAAS